MRILSVAVPFFLCFSVHSADFDSKEQEPVGFPCNTLEIDPTS